MNAKLYGKPLEDRVPKIAFLKEQILAREQALKAGSPVFYTAKDGTLESSQQPDGQILTKPELEEELDNMKEFLVQLMLPVNNGWTGSHCCAYGVILIRC